ncbi:c-type cytochrome [Cesiribacter sp. SM1]|uniref:c-type cytochrome n=1 Tax=Cesiribacter sp. SM1 TaxID=2861196 RepID=UPI001CD59BA4|nr:c-type cytochrome [Cesiribacter sp. SM1]
MSKNNSFLTRAALSFLVTAASLTGIGTVAEAQESPKEEDFFKIMKVSAPEGVLLEVGGLAVLPNGDLGISTRRGDVFIVENPTSARPYFRKFASGLHEILGLAYKSGALYAAQRGELTKLQDTDGDGKADVLETVYAWPLSGHYHEYSFGPKIAPDGSFFVTGNVAFGDEEWWRGESRVPWRGWTMKISEDGRMEPWATGMRSPAGLGIIDGELFYTDNQGDWMGSGALWHVPKGAFTGHPAGLRWTDKANVPLDLTVQELYAQVDPRQVKNEEGRYIKPENVVNEDYATLFQVKEKIPELQLPAVWLPYGILGVSTSEPLPIPEGNFGPFGGQVLVGDQGQSMLARVYLEKVKGEYQGASFMFRSGFRSGVLRMAWAQDGSLFVGETNRGWGSAGEANQGLQRLVWNNRVPFEMRAVRAMPDGFEIEFTLPVDRQSAEDIASYAVSNYTYKYTPVYGSPPVDRVVNPIKGVKVSDDGMRARIVLDDMRRYHVHEIALDGVRARDNSYSLVHPTAYYTLNNIPDGPKLQVSELSTRNSAAAVAKTKKGSAAGTKKAGTTASTPKAAPARNPDAPNQAAAQASQKPKAPTYEEVKGLLAKNTCLACHNTDQKQVGPAYREVAKRNYTNERIVELIHQPEPQNWPGYATPMPPMPQVPKDEALKIAAWINSLDDK